MRLFVAMSVIGASMIAIGAAAAQERLTEAQIQCQLGEGCKTPAASDVDAGDGSVEIDGGERGFCFGGGSCGRSASPVKAAAHNAVGPVRRPPAASVGSAKPRPAPNFTRRPTPVAPVGAVRPAGTANMALTFANRSAELSADARDRIAVFARAIKNSPTLSVSAFRIDGHTNAVGSQADNLELSRQRAQAVVDYMVSLGIPGERLQPQGLGFAQMLPGVGRLDPANRRVEIVRK